MSGHSKWSTIKRAKGAADAKRGQLFTKLSKEIIIAARQGGPSPEHNFRLRLIVQKCRDNNMPMENIERAIKKASGEGEGNALIEASFEGYGPGGVAILVDVLTDKRNRTLQELRNVFTRGGGSLGETGCVSWLFESKGVITISTEGIDAEEVALMAIDAGAADVKIEKDYLEIYTDLDNLEPVRKALEEQNLSISSSELSMIPTTMVELGKKEAMQTLRLLDKLEEMDDVQQVYSNADFSEEVLEEMKSED